MKWMHNSFFRTLVARPWIVGLIAVFGLLLLGIAINTFFLRQPATDQEAGDKTKEPGPPTAEAQAAHGKQLYANYCAQCHGESGDGNGPAAKYLNPKPRDFRSGKFRVVTTVNRVPSDQDLIHVITRGMPGSAMFPFAHLSEPDRQALVAHVRQLTRKAIEDKVRKEAADFGEQVNPAELAEILDRDTQPGAIIEMPRDLPPTGDKESIARGQKLYAQQCAGCHGVTGKGDGQQEMRDDDGVAITPRDFTRGIFKGGNDRQQLYVRIRTGMPGTPMPGSSLITDAEVGDLMNYVQSLSDPAAQAKVEHKRTRLVARRIAAALPEDADADTWRAAEPVRIVVSPLWWRNYAEPDLHVAALHDGKMVAIRLTWLDATRNDRPVRPQDFEDMAAVQLFQGSPEPFLGMGAANQPVDVWLWRASWQARADGPVDVDTAYPNMAVDLYPFERAGNGSRSHTIGQQLRDFITAWAAGNLNADPTRNFTGSNLGAKGFGTLTMRPRTSQLVSAKGTWKEGRWTVVLRRPLYVGAEGGLPLAPGNKLSIAFALWDGAAGDRNGQKLVSIWHDLELE
jgi:mono/diheme cytochrome c family protein